ncbi:MAG: hypothetical protein PHR25_00355 [Clostridia bacterium]|nr:hypothetical protein [Clostridia bacterium]
MNKNYECSICEKKGVKLWRPNGETNPLVCASCAEERQSSIKYLEQTWVKMGNHYVSGYKEEKLLNHVCKIDEKGKVHLHNENIPKKNQNGAVDDLIITFKENCNEKSTCITRMIPAVLNELGEILINKPIPRELYILWEKLPTR